jgi:RHS repeat-associated protein
MVGFNTTFSGGVPSYESTINYTYDAANRATQVVDSVGGTLSKVFDDLNRTVTETTAQGSISFSSDAAGRRTSMTVGGQAAVNYSYDDVNRLSQIIQGTSSVAFTYDNSNRRTSVTLGNGISMSYTFDGDSRTTGITYNFGVNTLGNLTYAYDALGHRTQVGGSFARTNIPQPVSLANYDAANQLINWNGTPFFYDANGNMLSDGSNSFVWDGRNQLAALNSVSLQYDGSGRRTRNLAGTSFLYDGINAVQELSGTTVTANLLTGGTDDFFTRSDVGGTVTPLTDAIGSTIALVDSTGSIITSYSYDPFGNTMAFGAASGNPSQFTARENEGNGLYYFRARYYSPALGRFISEDPSGFSAGVNVYAYAADDPIDFTDPLGLDKKWHNPFGIRAPGESFSDCVAGHADDYSLVGAADLVAGTDMRDSTLGKIVGGNSIMEGSELVANLMSGEGTGGLGVPVAAHTAIEAAPPVAEAIAKHVYAQSSFNFTQLANPIINKGAGMAVTTQLAEQDFLTAAKLSSRAAIGELINGFKLGADIGLSLAEFVGCSMEY